MDLTKEQRDSQRVVCAACRKGDVILLGARHFDEWMRGQLDAMGRDGLHDCEQGFIDQFGNFLTRREAFRIAVMKGQVRKYVGSQYAITDGDPNTFFQQDLYSENLY